MRLLSIFKPKETCITLEIPQGFDYDVPVLKDNQIIINLTEMKEKDYIKARNVGVRLGNKKAPLNKSFQKFINSLNDMVEDILKGEDKR